MLTIETLTKRFGAETAVENLSFTVERGEFVTLLGPSGCGKTTTLYSIAGHVSPDAGRVFIDGREVTEWSPERRGLGVVFQRSSLLPHMTARENITYALGPHDVADPAERVDDCLSLVHMADHADKYPRQLSGGQKRRIELARALSYEPNMLLLDEPLTGLDRNLRADLRGEIARIHKETGLTTLYVTHDQKDALTLSDRILIMKEGQRVAAGPPERLCQEPPSHFVADFLGSGSTLTGTVRTTTPPVISWNGVQFRFNGQPTSTVGESISLFVRSEDVAIATNGSQLDTDVIIEGSVVDVTHDGTWSSVRIACPNGAEIEGTTAGFTDVDVGADCAVGFDVSALSVLDDSSGDVVGLEATTARRASPSL